MWACHSFSLLDRGSSQLFFMFFMSWRLIKINLISQCIAGWVYACLWISLRVCVATCGCAVNAYVNRSTCTARRNRRNRVVSAVQNILISISNFVLCLRISLQQSRDATLHTHSHTDTYMHTRTHSSGIRSTCWSAYFIIFSFAFR